MVLSRDTQHDCVFRGFWHANNGAGLMECVYTPTDPGSLGNLILEGELDREIPQDDLLVGRAASGFRGEQDATDLV